MMRRLMLCVMLLVGAAAAELDFELGKIVNFEGFIDQGRTEFDAGNIDAAEVQFKQAALEIPDRPESFYWIGRCFEARGDDDKAGRYYNASLERDSTYLDALNAAASLATRRADWVTAETHLRRMADVNPLDPAVRVNLGFVYLAQAAYKEAESAFREAIRLEGELARAYDGLGLALDGQGQLTEAIEALRNSHDLDPSRMDTLVHLGLAYERQGSKTEAAENYTKALSISSSGPLADLAKTRLQQLGVYY